MNNLSATARTSIINSVYPQPAENQNTARNSKSRAYNLVVRVHATKRVGSAIESDCDCIMDIRDGIIQVGTKCAGARIEFLNREKRTPGHTRKTGGPNTKRREERKFVRSKLAFPANESERKEYSDKYRSLVSDEYVDQRKRRKQWEAAAI